MTNVTDARGGDRRSQHLALPLSQLVVAKKLREVRVQVGFTRIEPVTPDLQGEYDLDVQSQQLGLTTDWLPASE
ncbi:MAG: hypothetical protein MJE66_08875, partial [Proteobacteria bacterium]|nr:hypothetical protein [Pseudomonadota bacterium]